MESSCTYFCPKFSAGSLLHNMCLFRLSKFLILFLYFFVGRFPSLCFPLGSSCRYSTDLLCKLASLSNTKTKKVVFKLKPRLTKSTRCLLRISDRDLSRAWVILWILLIEYFVIFSHCLAEPVKLSSLTLFLSRCRPVYLFLSRCRPVVSFPPFCVKNSMLLVVVFSRQCFLPKLSCHFSKLLGVCNLLCG